MYKSTSKMEYADNGIIIRHDFYDVEVCEANRDEITNNVESYHNIIARAYGEIIANDIEIEAENMDRELYLGFNVKIEITPIKKEKDLFFKQKQKF